MRAASVAWSGLLSLACVACGSAARPDAVPASVAGEWRGVATVGPTVGCCRGSAGPVRLALSQQGRGVDGEVEGNGFRGRVNALLDGPDLYGTCRCATTNLMASLQIEAVVSGDEMVLRIGDARMTLTRAR